ncbi:hypothetical protein QVD17_06488 [Tagetes erecta]|uniref:BED-type domain-containing protein n=1 Tax=Tagetes erecta TaxID=13708 RepID=A0AAD8PBV5_TARER|nr:hypothetical protein QVD17_06488 [Tagetes erecta]
MLSSSTPPTRSRSQEQYQLIWCLIWNMDSMESPCSQPESQSSVHSNLRLKTDPAWKYATEGESVLGKKVVICGFCGKNVRGGGINRMKQHLGGVKGNISPCLKVPPDVKIQMRIAYEESIQKGKDEQTQSVKPHTTRPKRKASSTSENLQSYFERGINDASQPSIKSTWQSKERLLDTDLAVAMWIYHACIPMNAVNSPLFPIAMSKVSSMGHGYIGPSYHALRVSLLRDAKKAVTLIVEAQRLLWAETGCTIMSDGWRDVRQRPLINFLVYCPKGISFIKSVDASDVEANAENLCNLFAEIIEIVGYMNIVHFVTDNAANYKAAGKLLCEKYPLLCWSPCAAHCINLILKDISEITSVADLIQLASKVTVFIYNHKWPLNWLRKRDGWTEIIRPGATRFGTSFIALSSLYDHKSHLEAMVTSTDYKKVLKMPKAKEVKQIVLNENFWNNCFIIVKVMTPILRLLRICDSDEKPSLGYVFEGMSRAMKGIKELFRNKERHYKQYTNIIDARWDKMLRRNLHAAAYWLNPAFQYDTNNVEEKRLAFKGVLDMFEEKTNLDPLKLTSQLYQFRDREGDFSSRPLALGFAKKNHPDEWWKMFGGDVPELQTFAIRILSQTASSSGCERNWSVFERIHTKKRNRLEHQRLCDLVFVHYNLLLQNRKNENIRSCDPVDYESIDKTEFWVVDEEEEGELNYEELENMLEEEPPNNIGGTSNSQAQELEGEAMDEDLILFDDDDDDAAAANIDDLDDL